MRKVYIMPNAIELEKFRFSSRKRAELRKKMGLEDKFVVGNVARFSYQKNHELLIDIFYEISKKRSDAVLLLIGRGELLEEIKRKVKNLDLEDKVYFLGVRNDVPDLLNVMDVFVLPSRFEGLGMVFVEAQANGLKCFASEGVVPREVNVCGGVTFLSLSQPPSFWAQKILSADITRMKDPVPAIRKGHFDIDTEAKNLKRMYKTLCQ